MNKRDRETFFIIAALLSIEAIALIGAIYIILTSIKYYE